MLLAGCSSNETFENVAEGKQIGFETLNDLLTKAANDNNSKYGVFAKATTGATDFYKFNNREVTPGTGTNPDTYLPKELWPSYPLDFFAYAPYQSTAPVTFADGVFSFTVPADGQTDLTFAKTTNQTQGSVALQFKHMLSKIQLGTVTLAQNLLDAGYTLDPTAANKIKIWVEKNQGKNNLYTPVDWTNLLGTGSMYEGNNSYCIMPQTISGDQVVKIQLYGLRILKGGVEYKKDVAVKFAWIPKAAVTNKVAPAGDNGVFMKGRRYTINFTIGSDATQPDTNNPTDPTKPGDPIFTNYIGISSTVNAWIDEVMGNIGLNN